MKKKLKKRSSYLLPCDSEDIPTHFSSLVATPCSLSMMESLASFTINIWLTVTAMVASGMSNVAESPCRMALWIVMLTYPYMYHWQWQLWTEFITTHSDVHTCVCPCLDTCMHTQKHTPTHTCELHTWRTTSTYVYIHMHADARAHTQTRTHLSCTL